MVMVSLEDKKHMFFGTPKTKMASSKKQLVAHGARLRVPRRRKSLRNKTLWRRCFRILEPNNATVGDAVIEKLLVGNVM